MSLPFRRFKNGAEWQTIQFIMGDRTYEIRTNALCSVRFERSAKRQIGVSAHGGTLVLVAQGRSVGITHKHD